MKKTIIRELGEVERSDAYIPVCRNHLVDGNLKRQVRKDV